MTTILMEGCGREGWEHHPHFPVVSDVSSGHGFSFLCISRMTSQFPPSMRLAINVPYFPILEFSTTAARCRLSFPRFPFSHFQRCRLYAALLIVGRTERWSRPSVRRPSVCAVPMCEQLLKKSRGCTILSPRETVKFSLTKQHNG